MKCEHCFIGEVGRGWARIDEKDSKHKNVDIKKYDVRLSMLVIDAALILVSTFICTNKNENITVAQQVERLSQEEERVCDGRRSPVVDSPRTHLPPHGSSVATRSALHTVGTALYLRTLGSHDTLYKRAEPPKESAKSHRKKGKKREAGEGKKEGRRKEADKWGILFFSPISHPSSPLSSRSSLPPAQTPRLRKTRSLAPSARKGTTRRWEGARRRA